MFCSKVSLAQHNKNLNVRLTNPLPKDPDGEEVFEEMSKEEETWAVYVNFYLTSEIRLNIGYIFHYGINHRH